MPTPGRPHRGLMVVVLVIVVVVVLVVFVAGAGAESCRVLASGGVYLARIFATRGPCACVRACPKPSWRRSPQCDLRLLVRRGQLASKGDEASQRHLRSHRFERRHQLVLVGAGDQDQAS